MTRKAIILLISSMLMTGYAISEQTADQLVQSKAQENINYKQLMELLGKGLSLIQEGIIRENHSMVAMGTDMVMFHPAPNHKPWEIFAKKNQHNFKSALIAYDKILHTHADATFKYSEKRNWPKAFKRASDLGQSCISCHSAWKSKVIH